MWGVGSMSPHVGSFGSRHFVAATLNAKLLHPAAERVGMHVENPGCPIRSINHALGMLEHRQDVPPLGVFKRDWRSVGLCLHGRRRGQDLRFWGVGCIHGRQQVLIQTEYGTRAEDHGALDDVLQFPNVSGPGVLAEAFESFLGYGLDALSELSRKASDEEQRQLPDIRTSLV